MTRHPGSATAQKSEVTTTLTQHNDTVRSHTRVTRHSGSAMAEKNTVTGTVTVVTQDGRQDQVEASLALAIPFILREYRKSGQPHAPGPPPGPAPDPNAQEAVPGSEPILLPRQVTPCVLRKVLEYCRFHSASGRSDKVCIPCIPAHAYPIPMGPPNGRGGRWHTPLGLRAIRQGMHGVCHPTKHTWGMPWVMHWVCRLCHCWV